MSKTGNLRHQIYSVSRDDQRWTVWREAGRWEAALFATQCRATDDRTKAYLQVPRIKSVVLYSIDSAQMVTCVSLFDVWPPVWSSYGCETAATEKGGVVTTNGGQQSDWSSGMGCTPSRWDTSSSNWRACQDCNHKGGRHMS